MTTTPAHNEPSVLADGFLGIAFRRLREGLLPHMRLVLGADFQAEIGSQRNWHTVRLTDTEDLYYLLRVWLDNQDRFIRSFTPRQKDYAAGLDWPQKINGFHSEKWARQRHYADDEVSSILDAVAAVLNAIGASSQAASAEQLADELEAYLYQRARINRLEASDAGREMILSPAEIAAGQAIANRPDEPDVFAEGFLSKAWRRLGEGLGPYMERITARKPDSPRDVRDILSGNLDKVDRHINRECSNLLGACNKWAHQGRYNYRNVRLIMSEISEVLRAISENELAQAVDQMREALTGLRVHPTIAGWDSHSIEFGRVISPSNSRQPRHGGSAVQASPYYLPAGASGSIRPADTSEDYRRSSEWQNGLDAGSADVEQDLDSAHRFFEHGKAADQKGDIDQAIANYTRAITLHPQYADAYYKRGLAYDDKGEYGLAIADFDAALHINPQYVDAYRNRGVAYAHQGDYERAIADFDAALHINPQDATAYNNLGAARYYLGDYERAIADYDIALHINPQDATAHSNRGAAYSDKGDYDQAIADYDAALHINPQLAGAYNNRGNAYSDKGDYDQAIADYDAALRINPQDADAYNNRGNAYSDKGDYDQAIADFDAALHINPQDADAYNNRGNAYGNKGDYDIAIADFDAAIGLVVDDEAKTQALHKSRELAVRLRDAMAEFDQAVADNPDNPDFWHQRGLRRRDDREDYFGAIADFSEALRLDSNNPEILQDRARAYKLAGDDDNALSDYVSAVAIMPNYSEAYFGIGMVRTGRFQYREAIADFDQAIVHNPNYALAYQRRGICYHRLGYLGAASADFNKAQQLEGMERNSDTESDAMDLLAFKVVIEPDEDVWQSYYPAWEHLGAATFGDTPEQAAAHIKEVLEMIVEEIEEGEIEWPVPPGTQREFSKLSIQSAPELVRFKCGVEHAAAIASHGGLQVVNPETGDYYDDIYRLIYVAIDDVLAAIHMRQTFAAARTGDVVSRIFAPLYHDNVATHVKVDDDRSEISWASGIANAVANEHYTR